MPAKDRYHDTVIRALTKEGWQITSEQFPVIVEHRHLCEKIGKQTPRQVGMRLIVFDTELEEIAQWIT